MSKRYNQQPNQFILRLMQDVAGTLGAKLEILSWSAAGIMVFPDGVRTLFDRNLSGFVGTGSYSVARDKYLMNAILEDNNTSVPSTILIRRKDHDTRDEYRSAVHDAITTIGYPIFIKPNDGGMGRGVHRISADINFSEIVTHDFLTQYPEMVVQPVILGRDIRVIVFQDRIVGAMIREPLSVIGDGISTIAMLLEKKRLKSSIKKFNNDRIIAKLHQDGRALSDVLSADEKVYLLDNANLSSGGSPMDITNELHEVYKTEVLRIVKFLGLDFAGIDILLDGDYTQSDARMTVLEINSPCGVTGYASIGEKQYAKVRDMYIEMFDLIHKRKKVN